MSVLANYADLLAALDGQDGYLHRSDLTAKIPSFVKVCESRLNRKLRLLLQELEVTLTATISSNQMAVPTKFGTPIALWLTTYPPRREMIYVNPEQLPLTPYNSQSDYYSVDGGYIVTENTADQAYTYTLRYLTQFDLVNDSTNTVLTNYPDIYIYGTCLASVPFTRDTSMVELWSGLYDQAIKEAISDTIATKGKAMLRTEFSHERPNIIRGY